MIGNKTKAPVGEAGAFFLVLFKVRIGSKMAWPLFDLFDLIVKCNLAVDKVWHGVKTDDIAREVIQEVPADQSEIEHQAIAAEAFHGCSALGQYPKGSFEVTVSQLFIKNQLDKTETVVLRKVKEQAQKPKGNTDCHQGNLLHHRLKLRARRA